MFTKLAKWGNSIGIRIPKDLLEKLNLKANMQVELKVEKGRLVVEPITLESMSKKVDLQALLANYTDDQRHDLIDWGPPVGREIW